MKQLARIVVYWPNIDSDISKMGQQCDTYGQHQSATTQAPVHPWVMPEKPWSRVHVDHAIYFLGKHWLVMIDAYCVFTQQRLSQPRLQSIFLRTVSHVLDIRILLFRTMQPLLLPKCFNSTARREALFTLLVNLTILRRMVQLNV